MGAYGSATPKRHVGYSNAKSIALLNLGKLLWDYSSTKYQEHKTTKRSTKGKKKQFTGVKKTLKASQKLGFGLETKSRLPNFSSSFGSGLARCCINSQPPLTTDPGMFHLPFLRK